MPATVAEEPAKASTNDRDLFDFLRQRHVHMRSYMTAAIALERAQRQLFGAMRHFLTEETEFSEERLDGVLAAGREEVARAGTVEISHDDLMRHFKTTVIPAIQKGHRHHEVSRQAALEGFGPKALPPSKFETMAKRRARRVTIFGDEFISSSVGAVFFGPPDLVDRAVSAVRLRLGPHAVFQDAVSEAVTWKEGNAVAFGAPWWDSLYLNLTRFRSMVASAAEKLPSLDALVFHDLGRRPNGLDTSKTTPRNFLARALKAYKAVDSITRSYGGVLVAGVKLQPGAEYTSDVMQSLCAKCQRYDVSLNADKFLVATDVLGNDNVIMETAE